MAYPVRRGFVWPVVLLFTCCADTAGAKRSAQPQPGPPLPVELLRAWQEAGARVGWMAKGQSGHFTFLVSNDGLVDAITAFHFPVWKKGNISKLPDVRPPFGLDLSWSNPRGL